MAYTYLIGWRELDRWYYGYRSANKKSPHDDLWIDYFTSSKHVRAFREAHGEPDVIRVHKSFECRESARRFEHRLLTRLKVVGSDRWLNRTNGGGRDFFDGSSRTPETYAKISKALKGRVFRSGYTHSAETRSKIGANRRGKPHSAETKARYSMMRKGREPWNKGIPFTDDAKAKMSSAAKAHAHVCPHCGKVGGNVLFRWHFDNCKQKESNA
ncbi:homing endonucease [Acidovorax phage ACP17]|uniref:Homing endonucease n=1 Tax=Acidovorax phage ACP17 TaxID=2010329 RepID=A0A223AIZ2_9CAUD|nr:homing endonucease [Acidovorax phage ACP17]ASS33937.1 homing endonucease [Acidovorax phage ACP17]